MGSGNEMSCPEADAVALADLAAARPRADTPANSATPTERAEMPGSPGQQTLLGNSDSELPPDTGDQSGAIAKNVSNKAEIADSADPRPPAAEVQKPVGNARETHQMPERNTPRAAADDLAALARSGVPHNMGPDVLPMAAATPPTGAQVRVTVVPAMVPLVFQQAVAQTTVALSALPAQEPDPGDSDVADATVTAPRQIVARDIPIKSAARPDDGRAEPAFQSYGMDFAATENAAHVPTGSPGPPILTQATGPSASAVPQTAASVMAAVVGAIPAANTPTDRVEVILSPEELGRVQMDFRADGDGMRVFLTAERPETLDLLRRHADQLASELRQAGYSGASLSFGQWGQPQGEARHGGRHTTIPRAESHIPAHSPANSPRNSSGRGLDLRV